MSERDLYKKMDTLLPQLARTMIETAEGRQKMVYVTDDTVCRVCAEEVVDARWSYCSERCREIAQAVQRMFSWEAVREQVLERDEYTCQECGLSREMQYRAYWQVREIVDEKTKSNTEWLQLWERYGDLNMRVMEVDHIKRVADGGHEFDESNLRTLCKHCHQEKTAEENRNPEPAPDITLEDYMES